MYAKETRVKKPNIVVASREEAANDQAKEEPKAAECMRDVSNMNVKEKRYEALATWKVTPVHLRDYIYEAMRTREARQIWTCVSRERLVRQTIPCPWHSFFFFSQRI